MADTLQDVERFVRDFALFQQRFMNGPGASAVQRPPAAMAAVPVAAAQPPRRTA